MGTREKIVEAAERVMRTKGLARATTKEIARAAGYSEGTLYNHFESKEELFLCVLRERLPGFIQFIIGFPDRAGTGTVRDNLEELARTALAFYNQSIPMGASTFSEPALLNRQREMLRERGAGPHRANESVAAYLHAEQGLGRLRDDVNPKAVADLLLGACFQRAYWTQFLGEDPSGETEEQFVHGILDTLMHSIEAG